MKTPAGRDRLGTDDGYAVVVPARDMASTLAETLGSIRAQRSAPVETLVIDDGSTDDTRSIAESAGVRTVAGPAQGLGAAQNAGLEHVHSRFVAFVDADDVWMPSTGGVLMNALRATGAAAASLSALPFSGRSAPEGVDPQHCAIWREVSLDELLEESPLTKSATMYRASALRELGGFVVGRHAEDLDVAIRLRMAGKTVLVSSATGVSLRLREGSMSTESQDMLVGQLNAVVQRVAERSGTKAARRRAGLSWRRALAKAARDGRTLRDVPLPKDIGAEVPTPDLVLVHAARSPLGYPMGWAWRLWRRVFPRPH